jgi:hypothetical protein
MAQHDYVIDNAPGVAVRADINSVLQAIVTNNSAATEPATKYPNMWWYDTSTGLLKRRNNANDAWVTVGLEAADPDGALAANSDLKVATQKATKTYADTKVIAPASTTENKIPQWDNISKKLKDGLTLGTGANNLVQLDANAKLPPVDGSALTNLPSPSPANYSNLVFSLAADTLYPFTCPPDAGIQFYWGKFIKTSSITTVTCIVRIKSSSSGQNARLGVYIGGVYQQGVTPSNHASYQNITITLDVSGLTNGTIYDVSVIGGGHDGQSTYMTSACAYAS